MNTVVETSDKEKFDMYNLLDKEVLIGMLIEANKHLSRIIPRIQSCNFYMVGNDTSGRCSNCGKQQYEH